MWSDFNNSVTHALAFSEL